MISVETTLTITPELVKFERLAGRFSDFTPVLGGRVDVLARQLIRRMFETEGRAGGRGGWKGLSPNYLKRRVLPDRPILRQSDGLFEALTRRGHPDQEVVLEPEEYSLTIGEGTEPHARFIGHQLGIARSSVPQRQMIPDPLPRSFIDDVRRAVKAYVVRK